MFPISGWKRFGRESTQMIKADFNEDDVILKANIASRAGYLVMR